jgi:hypothetical protein
MSAGDRYELHIPGWRPALDNELFRLHWSRRLSRKRHDAQVLATAALALGVPRATGPRRLGVTIYGRYHRGAVPDDPAPYKSLLDGLVHAGLLVDDSAEYLELVWPPHYLPGPRATHLTLEEIGPDERKGNDRS